MFTLNPPLLLDSVLIFALAFLIDMVFGEYPDKIHPTIGIGKLITYLKPKTKHPNSRVEKANGVLMALIIMLIVALPVFLLLFWLRTLPYGEILYIIIRRNSVQSHICHPRHGTIYPSHRKSTQTKRFRRGHENGYPTSLGVTQTALMSDRLFLQQ